MRCSRARTPSLDSTNDERRHFCVISFARSLMMWAVLVGERELARALWTQTPDPLRSALVASLLSRQVAINIFHSLGHEAATLFEDAAVYEGWAEGLLEQSDEKEARVHVHARAPLLFCV